jgi:hypothetical protein
LKMKTSSSGTRLLKYLPMIISSNATRARHTELPCAHWRSNGSVFFFGVGSSAPRIMSLSISLHSTAVFHP